MSERAEVLKIWLSLYMPQETERTEERLRPEVRFRASADLIGLQAAFPRVELTAQMLEGFRHPPESLAECIFAGITKCVSADRNTRITPCQPGGLIPVSDVLALSSRIGRALGTVV